MVSQCLLNEPCRIVSVYIISSTPPFLVQSPLLRTSDEIGQFLGKGILLDLIRCPLVELSV